MCCKISLIFLFALFIIIHSDNVTDDPPCTDEQNFGPDMFCMLAFLNFVDTTYTLTHYAGAKYTGIAKVPKHRLDSVHAEMFGDWELVIVPDECETAYAVSYLIPKSHFNTILDLLTVSTTGVRFGHSVKTAAQVTIEQKTRDVYCNLFVSKYAAEKVKPLPLNRRPPECYMKDLVKKYGELGMPDEYLKKVSEIDTNPNLPCKD